MLQIIREALTYEYYLVVIDVVFYTKKKQLKDIKILLMLLHLRNDFRLKFICI